MTWGLARLRPSEKHHTAVFGSTIDSGRRPWFDTHPVSARPLPVWAQPCSVARTHPAQELGGGPNVRPSRFPVLWFFLIAYVITGVGACVHLFAVHRLPTEAWIPFAPYVVGTGPSLAGLLMTVFLYGLAGVWRLA